MGIPKSHRVDLSIIRNDDDTPIPSAQLVGLGLAIPASDRSGTPHLPQPPPPTVSSSPRSTSPVNRGFKVLSRPASHHPSPVLQQRALGRTQSEEVSPLTTEEQLSSSRATSRNNSGTSTPQRFVGGGGPGGGGSVSNLTSLFGTGAESTSSDPATSGAVIRARERQYRTSVDRPPVAESTTSSSTLQTATTTTTGTETDVDTDDTASAAFPTLNKRHSFRGLLKSGLIGHGHHGHAHKHQPTSISPPSQTQPQSQASSSSSTSKTTSPSLSQTHSFAPFPHQTLLPPAETENSIEHLRTTGVPVRRSLDYPLASSSNTRGGSGGGGGITRGETVPRPGMLSRITRAQSELRYPHSSSTSTTGTTSASSSMVSGVGGAGGAVRGRPRYGTVAGVNMEEERAMLDDRFKSPVLRGSLSLDEQVRETADLQFARDETGRKMINQYVILREIGRGQHGQVRLGQDVSDLPPPATTAHSRVPSVSHAGGYATPIGQPQGAAADGQRNHSRSQSASGTPIDHPVSASTSPAISAATSAAEMGVPGGGSYWAIKIVDRQPKKRLPGVRKMGMSGNSGLQGHGKAEGGQGGGPGPASLANAKLKREIAILKKCRHPNVVRLREVIDSPASKKIFMVLEYCQGGEIKWRSEDGRPLLTVDQARCIFRDVISGLEYLHRQGIIHRDIKPANLLYTSDGTVKISDFGVSHYSHVLRAKNQDGEDEDEEEYMDEHDLAKTAGSPAFFAPELCYNGDTLSLGGATPSKEVSGFTFNVHPPSTMGSVASRLSVTSVGSTSNHGTVRPTSPAGSLKKRPPITKAIDIWALGVTLYCFLFAKVPFDSPSEFQLFQVIPNEDFEIPETMGADRMPTGGRRGYLKGPHGQVTQEACDVIDLLDKLLEKDPLKRIALEDVKKHPFVLYGLSDPAGFLAKPEEGSYVNVTEDDVAAAVTNSSSFKSRLKKGMKSFGHKMMDSMLGSSKNGRSRSQSIIQQLEDKPEVSGSLSSSSQPSPASGGLSRMPSAHVTTTRMVSGSSDHSQYAASGNSSPRPGQTRRLSLFGTSLGNPKSGGRAVSPLPPSDRREGSNGGASSSWQRPVLLPEGDILGRSVSDRSTTSSSGQHRRSVPARRQSTHLVPPGTNYGERTEGEGRLNNCASIEAFAPHALDQMLYRSLVDANGEKVLKRGARRRESNDMELQGRQRALSNASSANSSGLGSRIGRIFGRSNAHKGTSVAASSVMSSSHRSTDELRGHFLPAGDMSEVESLPEHQMSDDLMEPKVHHRLSGPPAMRTQRSRDTFASTDAPSSVLLGSSVRSNDIRRAQLPPLDLSTFDPRAAIGISPEAYVADTHEPQVVERTVSAEKGDSVPSPLQKPRQVMIPDDSSSFFSPTGDPEPHLSEEADWDGRLSDDDEDDYGQDYTLRHGFDRNLHHVEDLNTGVWKLDASGWKGSSLDSGPSVAEKQGLGLDLADSRSAPGLRTETPVSHLKLDSRIAMPVDLSPGRDSPDTITAGNASRHRVAGELQHTDPYTPVSLEQTPKTPELSGSHNSPADPASPVYPTYPDLRRSSFSQPRGSPLRTRSPFAHLNPSTAGGRRSSMDRLGTSPMRLIGLADQFERGSQGNLIMNEEDSTEDDDEGLAFDLSKRGRRASKPLTPADKKSRLPEV